MFRAPIRRLRPALLPTAARAAIPRRAASTASGPAKKGTWKGAAARWAVAGGAVYWYCTSPIFADDPAPQVKAPVAEDEEVTVEKVIEQKRREIEARAREREAKEAQQAEAQKLLQEQEKEQEAKPEGEKSEGEGAVAVPAEAGSPQALEDEAGQQGAFNPETGEINWDCPCLGGMAHGPCGEEFRAAFSCFVYSEEEPKGMDCIDKFQGMQDCFRRHPDVYGAELAEEEEAEAEARAAAAAQETEGKPAEEPAAAAAPKEDAPAQEKEVTSPAPEKDALAANEAQAAPAEEPAAKEEKKTDA